MNSIIERKKLPVYFLTFVVVFVTALIFSQVYATSTISTDVETDGNVVLSNSASKIQFVNGWEIEQAVGATDELIVTDTTNQEVLVFDEE